MCTFKMTPKRIPSHLKNKMDLRSFGYGQSLRSTQCCRTRLPDVAAHLGSHLLMRLPSTKNRTFRVILFQNPHLSPHPRKNHPTPLSTQTKAGRVVSECRDEHGRPLPLGGHEMAVVVKTVGSPKMKPYRWCGVPQGFTPFILKNQSLNSPKWSNKSGTPKWVEPDR